MSEIERSATDTASQAGKPAYRVLARKYRPKDFTDLIGQAPMVRTLTNAFETGRIAQAYMLTGVRGVGKTTTARILARALNYRTAEIDRPTIDLSVPGEHCQAIMEGRHVDVIEMDAASHTGIDDIREIIEQVRYRPVAARYKVYIIDEVHMLSTQAFNGLLKTLEEPPEHVKFIFATTEIRKVPITVLSRCQRFDLRRIDAALLVEHFRRIAAAEAIAIDDGALTMIARAAEGSVRDGLSLLDQAIAHGGARVEADAVRMMLGLADRSRIVDLFERLAAGDVTAALHEFRDQYEGGASPAVVLTDLADFTHLVTRLKFVPDAETDAALTEVERLRGRDFAERLSVPVLSRFWQMLLKGIGETEASNRPVSAAEMVLIRLAHAADLPAPEALARRIAEIAADERGGSPVARGTNGGASSAGSAAGYGQGQGLRPAQAGASDRTDPEPPRRLGEAVPETPRGAIRAAFGSGGAASAAVAMPAIGHVAFAADEVGEAEAARDPAANAGPFDAPASNAVAGVRPAPVERRAEEGEGTPGDRSADPTRPPLPALAAAAARPAVKVSGLADILALAERHRDIATKVMVRRCVRLVRIEPGLLEIGLTDDAPRNLATDLSAKLEAWTGQRWLVPVRRDATTPTLEEAERAERDALVTDARQDPDVAAILARFPGARITDVRIAASAEPEMPLTAESEEGDILPEGGLETDGDTDLGGSGAAHSNDERD